MEESRLNRYGLKKIVPTVIELRKYLHQCSHFTDKRCYIQISSGIDKFISKRNLEAINYEQIASIFLYFEIMPEFLYFDSENNGDPNYYDSVKEINTSSGNLLILEKLAGGVIEFANCMGTKINGDWWNDLDKISWAESSAINKYELRSDGSIWFGLLEDTPLGPYLNIMD